MQEQQRQKVADAFGISENYEEGSAFDQDKQEQKRQERLKQRILKEKTMLKEKKESRERA